MNNLIQSLNPMQQKAVLKTEGPLLILAGAGSGKTRVLTHRIAYLISNGIRPFNILAITFTNKAAKEMKERVEAISQSGKDVWVSTFHSTCVRILRREINNIGYNNQFSIYDSSDSEKLIKDIIKELSLNDKNFNPKYVISEIGKQKDEMITPSEFYTIVENDFKLSKIAEIYKIYQKRLKDNNALDFDDLIFKTVELFVQRPDILEKYQERFKYILVDEYQDTNTSQYNLIRLLSSKYKNLCVVGDDDQSIYGWRGANIQNILSFEKDFPNTNVIKLEQNYRSSQTILDIANAVIKNNAGRKEKKLWTENNKGEHITFFKANSDLDESSFIADEISQNVSKGAKYNDFAILYRNNALSRIIEDTFVKKSIPYRLFGGVRFYERKEIKDVMSYLKVIYNPADDVAIKRIINVPKRGIGDTTIDKLNKYAVDNGMSFFEALYNLDDIQELKNRSKNIQEFVDIINELKLNSEDMTVAQLIDNVLATTKYLQELAAENTEEALSRIDNIKELISKARQFEEEAENPSLSAFLEDVALIADIDNYTEDDNAVVLMTMHSSKGLEFPNVFIVGFEDGIFPSYRSIMDTNPNSIEEERRLCYVGITRAKEKLYVTCSKSRLQHGDVTYNRVSRFFDEIPKEFIDMKGNAISRTPFKQNDSFNSNIKITKNNPSENKYIVNEKNLRNKNINNYSSYNNTSILSPKNISLDFTIGDNVRQMKYGIGKVKAINPAGADFEVTVEFPQVGEKKFMANLSKLKKVTN